MSERGNPSSAEERVREIVRSLPDVEAGADFRAQLRREFVAGTLDPRLAPSSKVRPLRPVVAVLAAAALLLIAFFANRGPEWRCTGLTGEGHVTVDGTVFSATSGVEELEEVLRPGARLVTEGEAQLDLLLDGIVAVQVAPGASLTLPVSPGRWVRRDVTGSVPDGEVRFVTGPRFPGATLTLQAPSATVRVTGTTFAVIASAESSCVCVLEGEVGMDDGQGTTTLVREGTRHTVFAGPGQGQGRTEEILPMERMKLEMLQDQVSAGLGAGR